MRGRSGRHAVGRGGAELVHAFRSEQSCPTGRASSTGLSRDRLCARRTPAGKGRPDERALTNCTDAPQKPGGRLEHALGHGVEEPAPQVPAAGLRLARKHRDLRGLIPTGLGRRTPRLPGDVSEPSNFRLRDSENSATKRHSGSPDGETRTRTGDTTIFSRVLYQLSYLAEREQASASRPTPAAAGAGRSAPTPWTSTSRRARSRSAGGGRTRRPCCRPGRTPGRRRASRPRRCRSCPP